VPDEQQRAAGPARRDQLAEVALVETSGQRLVHDGFEPELAADQTGGIQRACSGAREDMLEAHAKAREGATGGTRLPLAARRQPALEVGGDAVGLGVAMPKQPECARHTCEPIA
jgi:hypothetical protein